MKKSAAFRLSAVVLAVAASIASAPRVHAQASEFFDSFFSDNAGQPAQNFNGFIQWNVTNPATTGTASVDFVGGNVPGAFFYPTGRFVDLGGSTGLPGLFATKLPIALVIGTTYTLTLRCASTEAILALGGPGANTLDTPTPDGPLDTARVSVGGQTFNVSSSSAAFENISVDFVAVDAAAVLSFQDLGFTDPVTGAVRFDNSGLALDTVLLAPQGVTAFLVPEPGSVVMMGLGGLALAVGMSRRAKIKARQ